jgi:hypothetical protein
VRFKTFKTFMPFKPPPLFDAAQGNAFLPRDAGRMKERV